MSNPIENERIANQRKDTVHKISRALVDKYDLIAFEHLNMKGMIHSSSHLNKRILDIGWKQLIQYTTYKAEYAGKCVRLVDVKGISQACSVCDHIVKKNLSERQHDCS
ncbi:RNA-guided endonuclease InsQ/TnpB family protein [Pseudalkalibacillus sp. A8]|uniref:RNA-guided endonuclease InsQ/TnpB family protein n=1 Tax=Pseudalkalibacillus sp. A8 TaxID=3382641 RepID=UPI0038B5C958